jgi:hypothetical protein
MNMNSLLTSKPMAKQQYEYTFVRLGENWMDGGSEAQDDYRTIIQQHAAEGWRLMQMFSPMHDGKQEYYELIFERAAEE